MAGTLSPMRARMAVLCMALLVPVLPLFMGGRTPFAIAYLADALLISVMALVLLVVFWPSPGRTTGLTGEQRWWIGVACIFSVYLLLQILPIPALARWLGPYPDAVWDYADVQPLTWSPNPARTLAGLTVFLALWTAAYVARYLPVQLIGWLLLAVAGSALFQALYGLLAQAAGSQEILGLWERVSADRISGTFTNRNLFSGYMSLVGPLAVFIWWLPGVPGISRLPRPARIAGTVFTAGVVSLAMLATGARMGTLAGLVAITVTGYLWMYRMTAPDRLRRWYAIGFAGVIVLVLLWYGPAILFDRFVDMGLESSRWEVWTLMQSEYPRLYWLTGVGLGGFEAVFRTIQPQWLSGWYYDAHNDLLQWLLETGVVGLLLLVLVAIALWRRCWNSRMRAPLYGGMAAICVIALIDFSWHLAGTQLVIAIFIGLLLRPPERIASRSGR